MGVKNVPVSYRVGLSSVTFFSRWMQFSQVGLLEKALLCQHLKGVVDSQGFRLDDCPQLTLLRQSETLWRWDHDNSSLRGFNKSFCKRLS
jgi:hypothetical protein